jgi:hypothetical protein
MDSSRRRILLQRDRSLIADARRSSIHLRRSPVAGAEQELGLLLCRFWLFGIYLEVFPTGSEVVTTKSAKPTMGNRRQNSM